MHFEFSNASISFPIFYDQLRIHFVDHGALLCNLNLRVHVASKVSDLAQPSEDIVNSPQVIQHLHFRKCVNLKLQIQIDARPNHFRRAFVTLVHQVIWLTLAQYTSISYKRIPALVPSAGGRHSRHLSSLAAQHSCLWPSTFFLSLTLLYCDILLFSFAPPATITLAARHC